MEIKFIGQGLDPDSNLTTGNFIIDSLNSDNFNSFSAFVAFVSASGLTNIIDELLAFKELGGDIKLYVGVNLNATSKEALEKLLEHEIETYVVYSPNNIIYHPKIYAFEGDDATRTIVGSSNLTASGLFQNIEASVCVDFESDDEKGSEFLAAIYDHFNTIINQDHPSCQALTQEVLDILIANKIVLPEAVSRAKSNKINKQFGQKDADANKRLNDLFGKLKRKRPPKGFKKTVIKKELFTEDETNAVIVIDETTELEVGSMWIETRSMTGGSRNILDLSKSGKLEGQDKFGSVEYFGVNAFEYDLAKDINVIFSGNIYSGNTIFYPDGAKKNGTWRIRLNGETEDGQKITTFSKPSLGENGGFQYKILLFTKIDDANFRLEILEQDEMQKLIEKSSEWANGGSGNGRAYGIIAD
jgi:HKD family nuclease